PDARRPTRSRDRRDPARAPRDRRVRRADGEPARDDRDHVDVAPLPARSRPRRRHDRARGVHASRRDVHRLAAVGMAVRPLRPAADDRRLGLRHAECARRRDAARAARRELAAAPGARRQRRPARPLGVLTRSTSAASHRVGLILLVTVVFAWGFTWPVNKVIVASVPPLWAVAIRTGIGAVALTALALATRRLARPPRADLPVLVS